MSSTAVVQQKPLAERIYDRVKDQLGDMVTDDDLKPLVARAMEDAFFQPRVEKDGYGYVKSTKPPYIVEMVQKQLEAQVKAQVEEWFTTHPEVAAQAIEAAIAKGLINLAIGHVQSAINQPLFAMAQALREKGIHV